KKKKKRDTSPDGSPVAPAVQQDVDKDPFKDWKRNVMDVGNMSLFQWNLTTLEGMSSIQKDFKDERASFKHWFHALEAEAEDPSMRLTDDRIVYSGFGVVAKKKTDALNEKMRKQL
ncbi:unnamed protein product, partial [Polarella glacialis]